MFDDAVSTNDKFYTTFFVKLHKIGILGVYLQENDGTVHQHLAIMRSVFF